MRELLLPLVNRIHLLFCFCLTIFVPLVATQEAQAIPAFARTYDVNCTICQTLDPNIYANPEDRTELGFPSEELRQEGLVSDEEYQHKRQKILERL